VKGGNFLRIVSLFLVFLLLIIVVLFVLVFFVRVLFVIIEFVVLILVVEVLRLGLFFLTILGVVCVPLDGNVVAGGGRGGVGVDELRIFLEGRGGMCVLAMWISWRTCGIIMNPTILPPLDAPVSAASLR
jgi:hypothetical protein